MIQSIFFLFSLSLLPIDSINLDHAFKEAAISKETAIKRINAWYDEYSDGYQLDISGSELDVKITRYHPERPEEKNHLIQADWKGMTVTLAFDKPFSEIEQTTEGLKVHFNYVSIDDIYHDIKLPGWDVNPRTAVSSNSKKNCVSFDRFENGEISFTVNWEVYTVFGYGKRKKCYNELSIADGSVSEECMVGVRKTLPIEFKFEGKVETIK